jgi:hypothetical protein
MSCYKLGPDTTTNTSGSSRRLLAAAEKPKLIAKWNKEAETLRIIVNGTMKAGGVFKLTFDKAAFPLT